MPLISRLEGGGFPFQKKEKDDFVYVCILDKQCSFTHVDTNVIGLAGGRRVFRVENSRLCRTSILSTSSTSRTPYPTHLICARSSCRGGSWNDNIYSSVCMMNE